MKRRGMLLVMSAPSGGGKTTIVKAVLQEFPSFGFSVSATTRQRRTGEVDGKDYYFLSKAEFEKKIAGGELVEHEEIYSNYYGTLKSEVENALSRGRDIVFDVDVKGGLSIKAKFPEAVLIFLKPPSIETLRKRLEGRGSETQEQVDRRMARAEMELEKGGEYDYIITNDELKRALNEVFDIIKKKRKELSSGTEAD
jgi:guanylate kinase